MMNQLSDRLSCSSMCGTLHIIKHILQSWSNTPDMFSELPEEQSWSSITPDMFSGLPEEIIYLILIKLPAKDLVELMRVSKLFRSLISQPYFLDLHLSALPIQKQNLSIGVRVSTNKIRMYWFRHDSADHRVLYQSKSIYQLVGSTRGLICLFNWHPGFQSFSLRLWNPLTRKFKLLPLLPRFYNIPLLPDFHLVPKERCIIGFAFDHASVDFKVVVISYENTQNTHQRSYPAKLCVYAHKRNSWSNIRHVELPCYITGSDKSALFFRKHVSVGEFAYWLAQKEKGKRDDCILRFDVVNEVFQVIELPKDILESSYSVNSLRLFSLADEGSLALLISEEGTEGRGYFYSKKWSIRVMNTKGLSSKLSSKPKYWERYKMAWSKAHHPSGVVMGTEIRAICHPQDANPHGHIYHYSIGYAPSLALLDAHY